MSGLPKHFELMSSTAVEGLRLSVLNATSPRQVADGPNTAVNFPKRPDGTVLNETFPLFYLAQNDHGFWVAREAEGRCGGVFLLRRSAVRFAKRKSSPAGCATMFLDEPLELDVTNEGSRVVETLTAIIDLARNRSPRFVAFVAMAIAECRKLDGQLLRFCAREPKNRVLPELARGRYAPSSNDGDDTSP